MNIFLNTLFKLAGKTIFVIGLALNILMIFFGFWPSLIYIFILLIGAGLIYIDKSKPSQFSDSDYHEKWYWFKQITNQFNINEFYQIIITSIITYITLIVIGLSLIYLGSNYFKQRDTIAECELITTELEQFNLKHNGYPIHLKEIVGQNPLHSSWLSDNWNQPYHYVKTANNHFKLLSAGADGKFDTKDDIISSK